MRCSEQGEQTFDRNKVDDASSGSHFVSPGSGGREIRERGEKKLIFSKMNAAKSKCSRINLSAKSPLFSLVHSLYPLAP